MSNTSNELPALNMSEWLEPETFEKIVRCGPSVLASLSKLKTMLSKSGGRKRDLKKLGTEIDELRKDLEKVCVVMTQAVSSHTRLVEAASGLVGGPLTKLVPIVIGAVGNLNKVVPIVLAHEDRLKALEASIAKGKSKKGSRSAGIPAARKRHKRKK